MSSAIRLEGITRRFGSFTAVEDVSFEAPSGSITALLGPSGSGKSTVLRIIAGLEVPDAGRVWIEGEEQTHGPVEHRRVGFVFQHYALFRHMTVRRNIAFGLKVGKVPKAQRDQRVDELLALTQLEGLADRYPDRLSGGQRQRVALARALAPRPRLLLLDEPFGALDARVRQELRTWLAELHRELGVTSLLVTHDQEEALELAQRIVVMNEGRVEQVGSPADVYSRPATPFVAGFVGAANVLSGTVISGHVQYGDALVAGADGLADGSPAVAYVRPHDLVLSPVQRSGASVPAQVESVTPLGAVARVRLRLDAMKTLTAELPPSQLDGIAPGSRVYIDLSRASVFAPGDGVSDELSPA